MTSLKHKKILIFSVPFGTGHNRAAEAISKACLRNEPRVESRVVDSFSYSTPFIGRLIAGAYLEILKVSPRLYGFFYNRAESNLTKVSFTKVLHLLMAGKLDELIQRERPDVILCTHPFPLGVISRLRAQGRLETPLVAVVTDFAIHGFWLYDNVDLFLVGAEELKLALIGQGIPADKVKVTGIPVDPVFELDDADSKTLAARLGLYPELPAVLVMGGGLGLGQVENTVKTMLNFSSAFQVVVIAGRNSKLENKLRSLAELPGVKLKVFGHVDNVHEFMEVADLVVTKPGGLTIAEALAKGLPMILVNPIPGHEQRNLNFLTATKVAVSLDNAKDIAQLVTDVLSTSGRFAQMHATAKKFGRPTSAQEVARVVSDMMAGGLKG